MKRAMLILGSLPLGGCSDYSTTQPVANPLAAVMGDAIAPTLTAFDFAPASVNTSDGPATVTVSFTVTDDLSGATLISVGILNPSATLSVGSGTSFAAATSHSGSFALPFAQFSASGVWTVQHVTLFDAAGNTRSLSTVDLTAMGFPTAITVVSAVEDVTAPALTALDIDPRTVSTTSGPANVTVSFTVTDDLSGATLISMGILNPSATLSVSFGASLAAATTHSGSFAVPFAQFSESGVWTVQHVTLFDAAGNTRSLSTADLAAMGLPTTITVVNTLAIAIDIQPGSRENLINPKKQGKVSVAILSGTDFDAPSRVDRRSLTFGRTGDETSLASCARRGEDVNRDGRRDLVCHFSAPKTGFRARDTEGILRGQTVDRVPIEGRDVVRIVGRE